MTEPHRVDSPAPEDRLTDRSLYFNREISWLAFNRRVLEEALDTNWPLLERLKFLCIFHSNLDEFFMIRVSGLHDQLEASVTETSADGLSPTEQLHAIGEIVRRDMELATRTLTEDVLPKLAEKGVRILTWDAIVPERRKELTSYFENVVFPVLTPLAFDPAHPFPFLSNLSLSLAVELSEKEDGRTHFARVKVPPSLPRLVPVPPEGGPSADFLLLENLVEAHLQQLFPGMKIRGASSFRVTRDADMDIREDEAADLLRSVAENVRRRRFGAAIHLDVDHRCPGNVRDLVRQHLELDAEDVDEIGGPLGVSDLLALGRLERPDLKDSPFLASAGSLFSKPGSSFEEIRKGDVLLHHPYDSFDPVMRFLEDAATDPDVVAIKMTLYRTGTDSPIVAALARAAENGKQVAVLVELQARFDEEKNIQWAQSLERAGVHVAYGVEGLKTHAKIALVVRREGNVMRRYVHFGTGNYNRVTAKIYTDLGLLPAHTLQAPDRRPVHASREGPVADRSRGGEGASGTAGEGYRQDELPRGPEADPRPLPGFRRGSADRPRCSRDLLPPAGRGRSLRQDLGLFRRWTVSRAQPLLLLRCRRGGGDLHFERRLDAPQLLSPRRADGPDPGREGEGEDPPGSPRPDRQGQLPRPQPAGRRHLRAPRSTCRRARLRRATDAPRAPRPPRPPRRPNVGALTVATRYGSGAASPPGSGSARRPRPLPSPLPSRSAPAARGSSLRLLGRLRVPRAPA